jgi:cell division initiation protein
MITPMDIHNKQFSRGLRGYNEEEVRDFLQQIVSDYEQIYREHREMEDELDQMKTKLANYEKISHTMTSALQLAKDAARNVTETAHRNADVMISNAKAEGENRLREALENRRLLNETISHTEGNMKTYICKIRRDLELALAAINALDTIEAPAPMADETAAPEEKPEAEAASGEAPAEEIPAETETTDVSEETEQPEAAEAPETEEEAAEPEEEKEDAPAEVSEEEKPEETAEEEKEDAPAEPEEKTEEAPAEEAEKEKKE